MNFEDALRLIGLGYRLMRGDIPSPDEVRQAVQPLLVRLVPVEELAPFLDETGRLAADAAADAAERMKVGP